MSLGRMGNAFAAVMAGLGVMAGPVAGTHAQQLQPQPVAVTTSVPTTGKPVTLRLGKDFNPVTALRIERALELKGCPTELENGHLIDDEIEVEVGDKFGSFDNIGGATSYGEFLCLNKS